MTTHLFTYTLEFGVVKAAFLHRASERATGGCGSSTVTVDAHAERRVVVLVRGVAVVRAIVLGLQVDDSVVGWQLDALHCSALFDKVGRVERKRAAKALKQLIVGDHLLQVIHSAGNLHQHAPLHN